MSQFKNIKKEDMWPRFMLEDSNGFIYIGLGKDSKSILIQSYQFKIDIDRFAI